MKINLHHTITSKSIIIFHQLRFLKCVGQQLLQPLIQGRILNMYVSQALKVTSKDWWRSIYSWYHVNDTLPSNTKKTYVFAIDCTIEFTWNSLRKYVLDA